MVLCDKASDSPTLPLLEKENLQTLKYFFMIKRDISCCSGLSPPSALPKLVCSHLEVLT